MYVIAAGPPDFLAFLILIVLSAISLGAAWAVLSKPSTRWTSPSRLPTRSSALPLVAVFIAGLICYLLAAQVVEKFWLGSHPNASAEDILQSDTGAALLSTIPPVLALILMLAGDAAIFPAIRQRLGIGLRHLPTGALWGVVGTIVVVPPLFLLSQLMEFVYQHINYQHPTEHPLLHALGEERSKAAGIAIVVGACVIAPFWEELLFRGHLQTLVRRGIQSLISRGGNPRSPAMPWAEWGAIVPTASLFALMHPGWSWPIIFVLAMCLGYAYERTGNLWVSITMHALFNSAMTVMFLLGGRAQ